MANLPPKHGEKVSLCLGEKTMEIRHFSANKLSEAGFGEEQ
jgi:hypothetical protein